MQAIKFRGMSRSKSLTIAWLTLHFVDSEHGSFVVEESCSGRFLLPRAFARFGIECTFWGCGGGEDAND